MADEIENESSQFYGLSVGEGIAVASFLVIAIYNALELFVLIFVAFSSFKSLYFWSLLLTTSLGILPYSMSTFISWVEPWDQSEVPTMVVISISWWVMSTGQALVLYSRLHLVLRNHKILRIVLFMICANALFLHLPGIIITFGFYSRVSLYESYFILEKVQITVFFVQELIISSLYIFETIKTLRLSPDKGNRRIMTQLISINVIIILMDIGLLAAVFANLFPYEPAARVTVYSIKLKLEFAILGQLVKLANSHSGSLDFTIGSNGYPDFVDPTHITTDVTHARRRTSIASKPPESESGDTIDTATVALHSLSGRPNNHGSLSEMCGQCRSALRTSSIYPNGTSTPDGSSQPVSREGNARIR
ncbi:hypothetical protein AJ78_04732 [Emergomyces pasteurianus Ep9510]|uniref:DUF7703 domain-containing protein n=1 Tax=Emergomyces pasteurianus Ep9510 TaxID=1447872 RepID=A0A1J9PEP4_9EURO|nr:hypothetical protein AJ78_04732 [Emergomyces pasteurianus Ep9510]